MQMIWLLLTGLRVTLPLLPPLLRGAMHTHKWLCFIGITQPIATMNEKNGHA
jgi:hypothetical protein